MNPEYEKLFGGNIRRAREARGMTQERLNFSLAAAILPAARLQKLRWGSGMFILTR